MVGQSENILSGHFIASNGVHESSILWGFGGNKGVGTLNLLC